MRKLEGRGKEDSRPNLEVIGGTAAIPYTEAQAQAQAQAQGRRGLQRSGRRPSRIRTNRR